MARFLFVVPPLVGHVNPTVSLARELERRGHEVAWVGHASTRSILPASARFYDVPEAPDEAERYARGAAEARQARGLLAFKMLWEGFFLPLARGMLPGVVDAAVAFEPDVVVSDQQTLAGSLAARKLGLRWATTVTTAAGITDPLAEALPKVHAWWLEGLASLQRDAGLEPIASPDLSPDLVLVFSTEALVGARAFPAHYRFVGPSIERREEATPFSFDLLRSDVPRVLVSLGTIPAEGTARFYEATVRAFEPLPARQIVLVAPEGSVPHAPAHFLVRPFVPQLALLARVDAVVCHAGQNTVSEALAHGLPLVVLPIKYDQSVIAQQVADAGAGLRLKFGRVQPAELRQAVDRVLAEPSFRDAASRIRASFESAGGAARGASHLEAML